jgi:WD40 repeat protein
MFFAGGIDGRIHIWDAAKKSDAHSSIAANIGRINAMAFAPRINFLLSVSHDGTVKCWSLSDSPSKGLPVRPVVEIALAASGGRSRITAVTWIRDT